MEKIYKKNIFHLQPPVDRTQSSGHEINNTNSQQNSLNAVGHEAVGQVSQYGQDVYIIENVFKRKRNGFFLEIGAGDGLWISNTLKLEREFGWKGILVEPSSAFERLVKNRPNCICDNSCIASVRKRVTLFEIFDRGQAAIDKAAAENTLLSTVREGTFVGNPDQMNSYWGRVQACCVKKTVPLVEVLRKNKAPRVIDYFSLDVEGYEYEILESFPFQEYTFLCLSIERAPKVLQELLADNGYEFQVILGEDFVYTHLTIGG
jgi:hypothetical protein